MIEKIGKLERKVWKQHVDMNILENEKQELSLQLEILLLRSDYTVSLLSLSLSLTHTFIATLFYFIRRMLMSSPPLLSLILSLSLLQRDRSVLPRLSA